MECQKCNDKLTEVIPDLGYCCFGCFVAHPYDDVVGLLRDPEIGSWILEIPNRWRRASIDQDKYLEIAFSHYLARIVVSEW